MTDPKVSSLSQLRDGLAPARDLWPAIERRITSEPMPPQRSVPTWMKVAAAATLLVGVGIWIGYAQRTPTVGRAAPDSAPAHPVLAGACVSDAQFRRERTALLNDGALPGLPADSRDKVLASLQTVHDAVHDIESALARDSSSPLLQELLLTTCQDEIRVLTEVQAAGRAERAERGI